MKNKLGITLVFTSILLGACGQNEAKPVDESLETKSLTTEQQNEEAIITDGNSVDERLQEVTEDTICEFCNMKVYEPTHELGAFTAQGIKEDGSTLFFDDVGCILNQERVDGIEFEKFVRDNNSKDWLKLDNAIIVKADIKTPMNYGYAFFKDQGSADSFIKENEGSKVVTISEIDDVSKVRYDTHMEKMKNSDSSETMEMDMDAENSDSNSSSHGHTDSSSHNH
ncbi:nitrous oxide reductase accessory protein NosL [Psychrobacillus vulpis]|uniref:Nitrous oxide reductase accessory protein NosL n=1 Tax=Psychrobacillus vulpis TaxID=2325572 RepID=A0A544TWC3_9BACI|nr:nitrous oxide reductase accessory protein NosL [Psychrobacillus vulpis]TQR21748.1 hypothetical protein FG384_01995 [Psychrobacillus vulpis]